MTYYEREPSIWKGALAGAAGGLAGAWLMNQFQRGLAALSTENSSSGQEQGDGEDATMKAAGAIAGAVADQPLTHDQNETAGPVIHYLFGAAMGAAYGAAAEISPRTATGWGTPFGTALWLGADEIAVPALGLSASPWETPASTHASALAAHLVYGVAADAVRRGVRVALAGSGRRVQRVAHRFS
jgi:hypothetical protein